MNKKKSITSKKKKRYGFFLNLANYSPVAELHLAHILNLKKKESHNDYFAIICDGKFGGCSINPLGSPTLCHFCKKRALELTSITNTKSIFLSEFVKPIPTYIPSSLFLGAMSSVASHTRAESINDLSLVWKIILKRLHKASKKTYVAITNIIEYFNLEEIYIFNGRFSCAKAAKEAARKNNINFSVFDVRGTLKNHYIHRNIDLHNVDIAIKRANDLYKKDKVKATKTAIKYFKNRRNQKITFEKSYTSFQRKGYSGIKQKQKQIIVIFTQSDDEYRFLGSDWGVKEKKVKCSFEIKKIVKLLPQNDFQIIIRIHPNQIGVKTESISLIRSLKKQKNVQVHEPDSKIDTYALMDAADAVITFASSISLEACYWRKLLIQIGPSMTSKLNISNRVADAYECVEFLKKYNLRLSKAPKFDSKNAIIYANYLMAYEDKLPGFKKIKNGLFGVYNYRLPITKFARVVVIPEKFLLLISKGTNIISFKFLKKIIISILDIINGTYRDQ